MKVVKNAKAAEKLANAIARANGMVKKVHAVAPRGLIMYSGKSVLNGENIVVLASLESANEKTGNMIQTFILVDGVKPTDAVKSGQDEAICGSCPHRRGLNGACYVNIGQSVNSVYDAYLRGRYVEYDPEVHDSFISGRSIRFGAYGDPAAVPAEVWANMAKLSGGFTGYTHQTKHKNFDPEILKYCMVSADTPKQALAYQAAGLHTFRVKTPESPLLDGEIQCLYDTKGLQCIDCGLCDGQTVSVVVDVHGATAGRYIKKYGYANMIDVVNL